MQDMFRAVSGMVVASANTVTRIARATEHLAGAGEIKAESIERMTAKKVIIDEMEIDKQLADREAELRAAAPVKRTAKRATTKRTTASKAKRKASKPVQL